MKEFKEEKKKLEETILNLINEFEEKNECYISDIDLLHCGFESMIGNFNIKTAKIKLQFKLRD